MIKITNLTALESTALQSIANLMYAELGFSDIGATDVSKYAGIKMSALRGVLSSLVQKGHINILDRTNEWGYKANDSSWEPIIYLKGDAQGLVADWVEYDDVEAATIAI
jgi:predicted transcriptional regulator